MTHAADIQQLEQTSLDTPRLDQAELHRVLLKSMGVDGIYARTRLYEEVLERVGALISQYREPEIEVLRFPPVMSRRDLQRHGYLKSFPNLLACACALEGNETQIREAADLPCDGWTSSLRATELVLSPAACYPAYPIVAARGSLPINGLILDVAADCFRHEPSRDLDRLQSFRMREFVCFGTPPQASDFRKRWIGRGGEIAHMLALPCKIDQASDPFFGRVGQVMAASQYHMALKFELLVTLNTFAKPTACMSFNMHHDHFGLIWDIKSHDGQPAHTSCVAFGMDRITLALFCTHGTVIELWPENVRKVLCL